MKILFAASECMPFVKTGGLADVVGALPREIVKTGNEVRVILPLYRSINAEVRENLEHVQYFYINLGWSKWKVPIIVVAIDFVLFLILIIIALLLHG